VDDVVLRLEQKRIAKYKGKILRYSGLKGGIRKDFKRGETFDIGERYGPLNSFEGVFAKSCNTAIYATEWAARQLHPKRGQIVLHGADFTTKKGKTSHFFGNGKKEGCCADSWHSILNYLKTTVKFLWGHNIRLLNGSPWHGPLDQILPRLLK